MNVERAAQALGFGYGMEDLASHSGMKYDVLRAKLNPGNDRNHLTLKESVLIQAVSGRCDILHAMANELGHVAIPLPDIKQTNFPNALANACAEFGDYIRRANESMSDGNVTPNEMKRLDKELTEMIATASMLHSILEAQMISKQPALREE
jgi:hypothetical protein